MVYDVNNRPNVCPFCGKVQCHEHEVEYQCIECKQIRKVKVATIALRPGREAPARCRSCSKKAGNLSDETRIRLSELATERKLWLTTQNEESRVKQSTSMRQAYAEDRVNMQGSRGNAKIYYLRYPNGEEFWVQGTYEKRYAEHLLQEGIEFVSHPKGLKWFDELGTKRTYFPDFWLPQNNEYVDVKSEWTMTDEYFDKIDAVQQLNGVIITTILLD